jgi:hypothetical protein
MSFSGSMLSRITNALLLPDMKIYQKTIESLIKLLVEMEEIVKKLPQTEVLRYYEEWNPGTTLLEQICCFNKIHNYLFHSSTFGLVTDATTPTVSESETEKCGSLWTWFLDLERTCSHLIGRCVGEFVLGTPRIPEEIKCRNWLSSRLLSHGMEESFSENSFESINTVFLNQETTFQWIEELQTILSGPDQIQDHIQGLFSLIIPVALDDEIVRHMHIGEQPENYTYHLNWT